jgi:hypothetical protein
MKELASAHRPPPGSALHLAKEAGGCAGVAGGTRLIDFEK